MASPLAPGLAPRARALGPGLRARGQTARGLGPGFSLAPGNSQGYYREKIFKNLAPPRPPGLPAENHKKKEKKTKKNRLFRSIRGCFWLINSK